MGTGYNPSLAAGRGARTRASSRTPIHFWLDVPMYRYHLPCSKEESIHEFVSRTPMLDEKQVYCRWCGDWTAIEELQPINSPHSNDERIAFEQDKGILRERAAILMLADGIPETDEAIADFVTAHGIPVREVRKLAAALVAPPVKTPGVVVGDEVLCKAGLHALTPDNIAFSRGRRQCKACHNEKRRASRARKSGTALRATIEESS